MHIINHKGVTMNKRKIKLSLIDDYVKICLIKNFYFNDFFNISLKQKNCIENIKITLLATSNIYDNIFKECKMNDVSLLVLQKELSENNNMFTHQLKDMGELDNLLIQHRNEISNIYTGLKEKLVKLKINMNEILLYKKTIS